MTKDLEKMIKAKVKDGKVLIGFRSVIKTLKSKKLSKVIYAKNLPEDKVSLLRHNAKLAGTETQEYPKDGMELGLICGKPFSVGVIGIRG
jgi:large subunit ribosomal protein L30e